MHLYGKKNVIMEKNSLKYKYLFLTKFWKIFILFSRNMIIYFLQNFVKFICFSRDILLFPIKKKEKKWNYPRGIIVWVGENHHG